MVLKRMFYFFIVFVIWQMVLCATGFAQKFSDPLKKVEQAFISFDYPQVIRLADSILNQSTMRDTAKTIEILRLKAIAHYSLNQEDLAALSFARLLQLNKDYQLDPMINSPKIIAFFKKIKQDFLKSESKVQEEKRVVPVQTSNRELLVSFRQSLWRSMLLPGWGHLHQKHTKKGLAFMASSAMVMGASVYFILRTQQLEKDYLNSIEQKQIDKKYRLYNQSFKTRNVLLISYALLWGYTQIDLLQHFKRASLELSLIPDVRNQKQLTVALAFRF